MTLVSLSPRMVRDPSPCPGWTTSAPVSDPKRRVGPLRWPEGPYDGTPDRPAIRNTRGGVVLPSGPCEDPQNTPPDPRRPTLPFPTTGGEK